MFMDDNSTAQIAAGGIFAGTFSVNCANPLLSAQERGLLTATAASGGGTCAANPNGIFTGTIARRLLDQEQAGRLTQFRRNDYRIVLGLKGDLGKNWNYDGYLQYGSVQVNNKQSGNFNTTRIGQSLNAVKNAAGQIVCNPAANPDPGCVPINIFTPVISPAALGSWRHSFNSGNTTERVATCLHRQARRLRDQEPDGHRGVGVAFGAEYRREHLDSTATS